MDAAQNWQQLHYWIGRDGTDMLWWQMSLRALLLFLFGLAIIRLFGRRAFGKHAALDIVLAIIVGSNLSRALTGNAPFVATVVATTILVISYWIFDHVAARWGWFSKVVKGDPVPLMRDGRKDRERMRRAGISDGDMEEAARRSGQPDLRQVGAAFLERNGTISTIARDRAAPPGKGEGGHRQRSD